MVVLVVVLGTRAAHAEPPALSPVPLSAEFAATAAGSGQETLTSASAQPRVERSYWYTLAIVDVLAVAGLGYGLANLHHDSDVNGVSVSVVSALSLGLVSPLMHAGHGNARGGVYSFLLRMVLVPVAFTVNEWAGATTLGGVLLFDWVVLAWAYPPTATKSRSKRLDPLPHRASSSLSLVPTIVADGPGLVLGGRF